MSFDVHTLQEPVLDASGKSSSTAWENTSLNQEYNDRSDPPGYHALGYPEDDRELHMTPPDSQSSMDKGRAGPVPEVVVHAIDDGHDHDGQGPDHHVSDHDHGGYPVNVAVAPDSYPIEDTDMLAMDTLTPEPYHAHHPNDKTIRGEFVDESANGHRYYCHSSYSASISSSSCYTDDAASTRGSNDALPAALYPPVPSPPLPSSALQAMKSIRKKLPDVKEEAAVAAINLRHVVRHASRHASRKFKTYADYDDDTDDRVMIGTRIGEDHRNYQLMYDMLTGIRIAVGRVSAKIQKELTPADFRASHKLVFDVTGNELTPGVKYDFKFKDYAPWVFRHLREKFHIDAADYMMSLTNKYILSELGSPGKSGSFFYYSRDYRFIIKTIHHTEHRFLCRILKDYYQHVCENPHTLLCRFYGLHRIKLPRGRKIHFVVMSNVFPANKDIHETYDLKGSMFGRFTPEEEVAMNPNVVLKDQNWLARSKKLQLGPSRRSLFLTQLERDTQLLMRMNIMDYSLLIGIHDLRKGNTEHIRDHSLQMVQPGAKEGGATDGTSRQSMNANALRRSIRHSSVAYLDSEQLSKSLSEDRLRCMFSADDGGFRSTDEFDQPGSLLYFIGLIDILTPYNVVKKTEHAWKSMTQDRHAISSVHPNEYGRRFLQFIQSAVQS